MEKQWFEWEEWDQLDPFLVQFLDCTLIADVGPYKAGQKFSIIIMNYEDGTIQFRKTDSETDYEDFHFSLVLGNKIEKSEENQAS